MRRIARALLVVTLLPVALVVTASPAAACSCAEVSDEEYVELADVVFLGEFVDYEFEQDPDGDGRWSDLDPAVWTFEVADVYKGTAFEKQRVLSPNDGSACGLEIPRQGSYYVFARRNAYGEFPVGDGELAAFLCDGTRSADHGIDVELVASDPEPGASPTPATSTDPSTGSEEPASGDGAAAEPIRTGSGGSGIVLLVGFVIVGVGGVIGAARLRRRRG